jgi:hypothetical protein
VPARTVVDMLTKTVSIAESLNIVANITIL